MEFDVERQLAAALLISACAPASAQGYDISIFGAGNDQCAAFVIAVEKHGHQQVLRAPNGEEFGTQANVYSEWIAGYLTAYGAGELLNMESQRGSVDAAVIGVREHCKRNPADPVVSAVQQYILSQRFPKAQAK
jgi:hypothetical protein